MRYGGAYLCAVLFPLAAAAQPCEPYWAGMRMSQAPFPAVFGFDDGSGPTLYCRALTGSILYRWRHQRWEGLSREGLPVQIEGASGVAVFDDDRGPAIYGQFYTLGSPSESYRFRDGYWMMMPSSFWAPDGTTYPMTSAHFGEGLHIYGRRPAGGIARWNGTSWDPIGQVAGGTEQISAMIGWHDGTRERLDVFGSFTSINGIPAVLFASWDGQSWSAPWPEPVQTGEGSRLLTVFDDGSGPKLYTNYKPSIQGIVRKGLHRWDGEAWEFVGGPDVGPTTIVEFDALAIFDDGTGPGLYITGTFPNFGGVAAKAIVRYDSTGFHAVAGSVPWQGVRACGVVRDGRGESLAMVGAFAQPAVLTIGFLVGCNEPICPADCNADGKLNINDFVCFTNSYAARTPFANAQPDAALDIQDFVAFLGRFSEGCPQR